MNLFTYVIFKGVTSDSVSADRNSKFDLDDEWVDVDNTSDELQEIIVLVLYNMLLNVQITSYFKTYIYLFHCRFIFKNIFKQIFKRH